MKKIRTKRVGEGEKELSGGKESFLCPTLSSKSH